MVTLGPGNEVPATTWDHYRYAIDAQYGDAQVAVWHDFWTYYKLPDDGSHTRHAKRVFNLNAAKITTDTMSYVRIQAIAEYLKKHGQYKFADKRALSKIYLTKAQYREVMIPWMVTREEGYYGLCRLWASKDFIENSQQKRDNRGTEVSHTMGGDGHICMAKRIEARIGVVPSDIQVYLAGHKRKDPSNPDQLCSQSAKERLDKYGQEMIRLHGDEYDWRNAPVDPSAVYASGGGKPHERYAMFHGVIDSSQVESSSGRRSRRSTFERNTEVENLQEALRQQQEAMRQQQEYSRAQQEAMRQQQEYYA